MSVTFKYGLGLLTVTLTTACGGSSSMGSRKDTDAAATSRSQADGTQTGTPSTTQCMARTALTLAVRIVMDATWPGTIGTASGEGLIHLWNLSKIKIQNGDLAGSETRPCGTVLPETSLSTLGQAATGGSRVLVEVPFSVWDQPSVPKFPIRGRLSGLNPGGTLTIDGSVALLGLTLDDPQAPWPDSYTMITTVDTDGDGKPGLTAVPRNGDGFVQPPTSIGFFGSASTTEKLYLVSRTGIELRGMLSSCNEISGTANVTVFDNHVVGCRLKDDVECNAGQIDFIDKSRTVFEIRAARFIAKTITDDASCADARAALPM